MPQKLKFDAQIKILFILIQFSLSSINAQNTTEENIFYFSKVWGFLKYYHPKVASGAFDWDQHYIEMLPDIESVKNKTDFSLVIHQWIKGLGKVPQCSKCDKLNQKELFLKKFNLEWLEDQNFFTQELSEDLLFIEKNRYQGQQHYVRKKKTGNIEIQNEPLYNKSFIYPSRKLRLLGLAKFWNTVEYFFPYKYMTDQNWDEVFLEMLPKISQAKNVTDYHLALLETVVKLDDTHANLYTHTLHDFFGRKTLPVFVDQVENKLVVTSILNDTLARQNDLRIGDVIETVNGESIAHIINKNFRYAHGSNKQVKSRNFDYLLFNGQSDSVELKIERKGRNYIKTYGRYSDSLLNRALVTPWINNQSKMLTEDILYLNMEKLKLEGLKKTIPLLKKSKGLIIDLRNYPRNTTYQLARFFYKEKKPFAKIIAPDLSYPGKFYWKEEQMTNPPSSKLYFEGKIILLVNKQTQSRGEYSAMILQTSDNIITLGSQTAGADGDVSAIEFVRYRTFISGLGIYYPNRTPTQRIGIRIDEFVEPTIKGLQEGKDEVLEIALERLRD